MICHGISTGALFMIVGQIQERTHTRAIDRLGGLWATVPRLSGAALFFAVASMGLPGLGDFVGEFLVLLGTYQAHIVLTAIAAVGILASTFYGLRFVQGAFHGPNVYSWKLSDLMARELAMVAPMAAILVWLGLYPQPVFNTFRPGMDRLERVASQKSFVSSYSASQHRPRNLEEMSPSSAQRRRGQVQLFAAITNQCRAGACPGQGRPKGGPYKGARAGGGNAQ
jgi:NADH-quinone oxidoreductase subunit M